MHGGFAHRLYRLDTDQGSFAVKELNLDGRRPTAPVPDVFRFEQAAFTAGISMPEPISASHDTLVHRWLDANKVPEEPVSPEFGSAVGEILARLHRLDVVWTAEPVEEPTPHDWPQLAQKATETSQPWAELLAARVDTLLAIADFVDTCPRPGPVVLTHRDIQPWNLLARDGRPVVLDWELSGRLDLSGELGSTALSLAKGRGLDDIRPDIFRSILDGYIAGGGALPPPGPSWFAFIVGGWLAHTRWNVLRCLAGVELGTGPEQLLSHGVVRDGLIGLPALFARLEDLEALLL